ncbi:MAG: lasso peptide biosynthesis protein [Clostridia bacterium]|nr:lasso peptide biosynthesis protein [Clostridia bacterium]
MQRMKFCLRSWRQTQWILWFVACIATLFFIIMAPAPAGADAKAAAANAPRWPQRTGKITNTDKKLGVDASNAGDGYIYVYAASHTNKGLKLRISKDNVKLDYDIPGDGTAVVIPVQLGSGKYEISMFENVKGSKYSQAGKMNMTVQLLDPNNPFLVPNQYVDYNMYTAAVLKSQELCVTMTGNDNAIYDKICQYMSSSFFYDFVRAKTIKAGVLPDIDYCWSTGGGVCQDLSAVMCCMLRVQGIPCKLMIGYADKQYHAWTVAVVNGEEKFFDPTVAVCPGMTVKRYSVERYY